MEWGAGRSPAREFEAFVALHVDLLVRTAYQVTLDAREAEDVAQEALVRLARHWPRVRRMDHPLAYARKVVVHRALDTAERRARRRAELSATAPEPVAAEPGYDRAADREDLRRALALLAPRQRATVVCRYWLDLSEAETAELLGCSVGTVKSTTHRALGRLRGALEPLPEGTP